MQITKRFAITVMITAVVSACTPTSASGPSPSGPSPSRVASGPLIGETTPSPTVTEESLDLAPGRILFSIEKEHTPTQLVYLTGQGVSGVEIHLLNDVAIRPDPTLAHATWASETSIVFDSERAGDRHLFRFDMSDGTVTQLLDAVGIAEERPAVAPDGRRIAFDQFEPEANHDLGLQSIGIDGLDQVRLTPPGAKDSVAGDTEPAYSPDGRSIAYIHVNDWEGKGAALFVIGVDGGTPRRLTTDDVDAGYPRWSPDGRSILFSPGYHGGPSDGRLWIAPSDGGTPSPLGDPVMARGFEGDWSPDGTQIVFKYHAPGMDHNELRVMDADGTNVRTIWVGGPGQTAETPDWGL